MRKKILIVDDSPVILKTLSMKLTANGYDVVTALDGSDAVSAVRREHPDLGELVLKGYWYQPEILSKVNLTASIPIALEVHV